MSNSVAFRAIEALNPEQLAEALLENGYPQCRQLIIDKAIDGKKFLGLNELEIKRFQMYLHQSDARRFWSFVQRIKEHPEEFTLKMATPPQVTKPPKPKRPNKPNQQIFSIETSLRKKINEVSKKVRESSDEENWQNDWSEDEKEMIAKPPVVSKNSLEGSAETKLAFEKNRERIQQLFKGRFEDAKPQEVVAPKLPPPLPNSTEPIYVNIERNTPQRKSRKVSSDAPPLPPQRSKRNISANRKSNVEDDFPPPPSPISSDDEMPPVPPPTSTIPSLRNLLTAPPTPKAKDVSLPPRREVTPPPPPVKSDMPPIVVRPPPGNNRSPSLQRSREVTPPPPPVNDMPPTVVRPPPGTPKNRSPLPQRGTLPPPLPPSNFKTATPPSPPPQRKQSRTEATPPPIPPLPNKPTSLPGTPRNRSPLSNRNTPPPPLPPGNLKTAPPPSPPPVQRNVRQPPRNDGTLPLPPKLPPTIKDFPSLPPRPPRRDESPDVYDEPLEPSPPSPRPPPKISHDPEDQYEPPPTIFPGSGGLEPPAIPGRPPPRGHNNDDEDPEGYLRADNFRGSKESIGSNQDRPLPPIPTLQSASSELERSLYYRNIKRSEGEALLEYQMLGAFILRPSNKYYATMVVKGKHKTCNVPLVHEGAQYYLLMDVNFAKDTIKFNKLDDLITHYTRHPIPLKENSLCLMRSHNLPR